MNKYLRFLFDPAYRFEIYSLHGLTRCLSDEAYARREYRLIFHRKLDLKSPQTFNEKLQWLRLYDRKPLYPVLADKFRVRQYIADTIGESYLIPLAGGPWKSFDEIDFDQLPDQFVLKCTHDSGSVLVCRDKSSLDRDAVRRRFQRSLSKNFYDYVREWPYKNIEPQIIAEQYMHDPAEDELHDYKFFCFNGKVRCLKIDFGRFVEHHANYYDPDMNLLPFGETVCPPDFSRAFEKPANFEKMLELSETLAACAQFMRVDLYNVRGRIYFGELTLYPASGFGPFVPDSWDKTLGSWLDLSAK